MYINQATIEYENVTTVAADESQMSIVQHHPEERVERGPIVLCVDELRDLVDLAKLLGWEIP